MALNDTMIRAAKPKERAWKLSDEKGLYLLVSPTGSKLWRLKFRVNGKEKKLSFGAYPDVTLKDARRLRDDARAAHAAGVEVLADWIEYLRGEKLYGEDDAAFPSTDMGLGAAGGFQPIGLRRDCWKTAEPVRRILKQAYTAADLPYFPPHRVRDTLAQLGLRICRSPEEFKAWSQNIGHTKVLTTFMSYGQIATSRQAELIKGIGERDSSAANDDDLLNDPDVVELLERISKRSRR